MATIEGNEIALRKVAAELSPPVRSGQDARTSQDDFGSPFVTLNYNVYDDYSIYDPNTGVRQRNQTAAPAWVYGLVVEPLWDGFDESSQQTVPHGINFYAAFGAAQKQYEVQIQPGKVLRFPRGARRVFLRCDVPAGHPIRVTWIVDRFATINTSGAEGIDVTRTWFGDALSKYVDPQNKPVNNGGNGVLIDDLNGYTNMMCLIDNQSDQAVDYELVVDQGVVVDTGNVPSGDWRYVSYGPGVGNLSGKLVGHGIVLPVSLTGNCKFQIQNNVNTNGLIYYTWRAY